MLTRYGLPLAVVTTLAILSEPGRLAITWAVSGLELASQAGAATDGPGPDDA